MPMLISIDSVLGQHWAGIGPLYGAYRGVLGRSVSCGELCSAACLPRNCDLHALCFSLSPALCQYIASKMLLLV